ncbi:hypothetical protein MYMA111404_02300 [Mycoplasma marinum]
MLKKASKLIDERNLNNCDSIVDLMVANTYSENKTINSKLNRIKKTLE